MNCESLVYTGTVQWVSTEAYVTMRGLFWGGRPTAGAEDWVGWGLRSGTQSLALRPQQMAAEQRGCRETLIVHSEWLSVRKAGTGQRGRRVEGGTDDC